MLKGIDDVEAMSYDKVKVLLLVNMYLVNSLKMKTAEVQLVIDLLATNVHGTELTSFLFNPKQIEECMINNKLMDKRRYNGE